MKKKGDVFVTQKSSVIIKAVPDANFSKPQLISHNEILLFQHDFSKQIPHDSKSLCNDFSYS